VELSNKIASDITINTKYAKHRKDLDRRETWDEICDRKEDCLIKKYPDLADKITKAMKFERQLKVLGSMRMAQFAGVPVERNHSRVYNCAYHSAKDIEFFSNTMFLLLGGSGVGYSVQHRHIDQLPPIQEPLMKAGKKAVRKFLVSDTIEGWADAIKVLMNHYLKGTYKPKFDFSDIREKGMPLITAGGKAPGPEPLRTSLSRMQGVLDGKEVGQRLSSCEVSDLCCFIADAVYSGGIRRAAMICLFDMTDEGMLGYKAGAYWDTNPHRARVNVSAVAMREGYSNWMDQVGMAADEIDYAPKTTKEQYNDFWKFVENSGTGEPGIYWTNDPDVGTNPCCFTGENNLLTRDGYKRFDELEGECDLVGIDGEVYRGEVWKTGVKETVKVRLSNKKTITCTPDHIFMTANGLSCHAIELEGHRLKVPYTMNKEISEATKAGFLQGDAVLTRMNSKSHRGLEINIGENDKEIADLFDIPYEEGKRAYYSLEAMEIAKKYNLQSKVLPEREMPETIPDDILGFLCGMYSANGSVIKNHRVAYKTTCRRLAQQLSNWLSVSSIDNYITTNKSKEVKFPNGTYTCKESYDVNITRLDSVVKFAQCISFVHQYKRDALDELIASKSPKVLSVTELSGGEVVYDFNIRNDNHWGVVEGVVVHNCEIALKDKQFCNLTTINFSTVTSQADLIARAKTASFLGTLQAGFTDFHYLGDEWQTNCEEEALLGVSVTGIADGNNYKKYDWPAVAEAVVKRNTETAKLIGINPAARTTCIKPEGTTSLVCGTASGIHGRHAKYYLRRMRFEKSEPIAQYLMEHNPAMIEQDKAKPTGVILVLPQKSPDRSIYRTEDVFDLLERVKYFSTEWVRNGHIAGSNTHNVSCTISVKPDEWKKVGAWMWANRDFYNGIAVLPYDGGQYIQAPFEDCTKEKYETLMKALKKVDLTKIVETDDNTVIGDTIACQGGQCEI